MSKGKAPVAKAVVPHRPMPLSYIGIWIVLMTVIMVSQAVTRYGWPLAWSGEVWIEEVTAILFGAWFWGWICWRFWLQNKYPRSSAPKDQAANPK